MITEIRELAEAILEKEKYGQLSPESIKKLKIMTCKIIGD